VNPQVVVDGAVVAPATDGQSGTTPDVPPDVPPDAASTRRSMPLVLGALYSVWAALACDAVLDISLRAEPIWQPGRGALVSLLVVWCVVLLLIGLTGRIRRALTVLAPLCLVIGAANWKRMSILEGPVVPSDLTFLEHPGFLEEMVGWRWIAVGAVVVVAVTALVHVLGRLAGRRFQPVTREHPRRRAWLVLRAVLVLVCGLALVHTTTFNRPGNLWSKLYDAAGVTWAGWDQVQNYQQNGLVGGFLYNLPAEVEPPAGYDAAAMKEIADRYTERAAQQNQHATTALAGYNVVLVLSESFSDPTKLAGLELGEDPIPHTRAVAKEQWGGESLAIGYGNGTSTMEFQALTGQAEALFDPRLSIPYQQIVPGHPDYPSAVGWFKDQGYRAVAIHAYSTMLYNRENVYENFGFDDFVHDTTMHEDAHVEHSPFISDKSTYDELVHQIRASDKPLFAHVVTMQNHVPTQWYDDPVEVTGTSGSEAAAVGGFARGLSYTDADLPALLDGIKATGEPTVVVFFGDHFPGIFSSRTRNANSDLTMHTNPMFVWSSEGADHRALPVTNPVSFLPLALERIGAPLPPYYELLREAGIRLGALGPDGVVTRSDTVVPYADLDQRQQQVLRDLRMVQYDFSFGQRYALDEMWPGAASAGE
jgi:phosphoglycerol transferase MdoB-like AlkP superfamily enzyme